MSQDVGFLFMGVYQGYALSNNFVLVLSGNEVSELFFEGKRGLHNMSSQVCFW